MVHNLWSMEKKVKKTLVENYEKEKIVIGICAMETKTASKKGVNCVGHFSDNQMMLHTHLKSQTLVLYRPLYKLEEIDYGS